MGADKTSSRPPPLGAQGPAFPLSVEDAEHDAERIAAFARIATGVIIAAGVLTALSFVPENDELRLVERLILALGIMAGFVVLAALSYLASRADRYRPHRAYVFVVADVALITVALAAGLHFAGQPGLYVFAQPPVWLIPIVIAMQAIRFRSGPLVLAAILFALSLLAIMLFLDDPAAQPAGAGGGEMPAMFSFPPDAIRTLMLMIMATVLVISVRSKRDILLKGLQTARREAELQRFLPPEVSRDLAAAQNGIAEGGGAEGQALARQRVLAILFIDLVGFTRASEGTDPAIVAGWLAGFREAVNRAVQTNGGFVDKFIGDGIMAVFGYSSAPETAARQAIAVIDALPGLVADWQAGDPSVPDFQVAAGGAIGPVFVGVVGSGDRREFTVIGDAVNVAARLEGFAKERKALAAFGMELAEQAGLAERFAETSEELVVRGRQEAMRVGVVARG